MATESLTALTVPLRQDPFQNSHELIPTQQTTNYGNNFANGTFDNFYDEVSNVQGLISQFDDDVARVTEFLGRSLNANSSGQNLAQLDDQLAQTLDLGNRIKRHIAALVDQPVPRGQETRRNQVNVVANQFMAAIRNYTKAGEGYRQNQRAWIERKFKNIKPNATPEEVTAVVENTDGTGGQIFSQALSAYGESRALYKEVQDRHEDIKRIGHTLEGLAQLYNDVRVLVPRRDESIDSTHGIQNPAHNIEQIAFRRIEPTDEPVVTARAGQKKWWKKWWFYLWFLLAAIIITITIVSVVKTAK